MAATDQEILDAARDALKDILTGKSAEFREGTESARLLEIDRLERLIAKYERKVNGGNIVRPIREVSL